MRNGSRNQSVEEMISSTGLLRHLICARGCLHRQSLNEEWEQKPVGRRNHFGLSTSSTKACGQPSNGFPWRTSYEVFMVEAGAEKICVVHLGSRCQKETIDESLDRICTSCSGLNIDFLLNHPCFSSSFFVICWGFNRGK